MPCMAPAVKGWKVCRFHGARGGAPKGERNGRYRHGLYCQTTITEREMVRDFMNKCIAILSTLNLSQRQPGQGQDLAIDESAQAALKTNF
jgi:hypothetical protein